MSEHVHAGATGPAVIQQAPLKAENATENAPRLFKRRIDCEDTRERVRPVSDQRKGRGGRRRTDKPIV